MGMRTRCGESLTTSGGSPEVSRPKTKRIVFREVETVQGDAPPGAGEDEPPPGPGVPDVGIEIRPYRHSHMGPIIEPRPLEVAVFKFEPEGFDKMQRNLHGGAQSGYIARIRGDFRLEKNDMHTGRRPS